jgi:hypothetical protein
MTYPRMRPSDDYKPIHSGANVGIQPERRMKPRDEITSLLERPLEASRDRAVSWSMVTVFRSEFVRE